MTVGFLFAMAAQASPLFAEQEKSCQMLINVISAAYRQILGRPIDIRTELSPWTRDIGSGQSVFALVKSLALSDEYLNGLKALAAEAQADSLYKHILGRKPLVDGLATQQAIRVKGIREAAVELLNSPEFRERFGRNSVPAAPDKRAIALCP